MDDAYVALKFKGFRLFGVAAQLARAVVQDPDRHFAELTAGVSSMSCRLTPIHSLQDKSCN